MIGIFSSRNILACIIFSLLVCQMDVHAQPHLVSKGQGKILIVNGKPFAILGGELHNSSASNLDYMHTLWDRLTALHLNTVIAPVSWELFEPKKGRFDFTLIDGLIKGARSHDLKLVMLWFGAWKNTWSSYAPDWVKRDLGRFPRRTSADSVLTGALSTFGTATLAAEQIAFSTLMSHIRIIDEHQQTVLMVQVENEMGMLNGSRDRCPAAEACFNSDIPVALRNGLQVHLPTLHPALSQVLHLEGHSWAQVFGPRADECFMAWQLASYADKIASTGRSKYNLPMYVNAWLDASFGTAPSNSYPSGGPVSHLLDIWKIAAPHIDVFSPDIYIDSIEKVCSEYTRNGNSLFIPEVKHDSTTAAWSLYALGQYHALGFAPFGIEDYPPGSALARTYRSIAGLTSWLYATPHHESRCLLRDTTDEISLDMAGSHLVVHFSQKGDPAWPIPCVWACSTRPYEIFFAGHYARVEFNAPGNQHNEQLEIISHEEGKFVHGRWVPRRQLNGDELDLRLEDDYTIHRLILQKIPRKITL